MTTTIIAEGKTKILRRRPDGSIDVESKNFITAGDGKVRDEFPQKGDYATKTTCNVFALLASAGLPVAFEESLRGNVFRAKYCDMLPYEVVCVRHVSSYSSARKREPWLRAGHEFHPLKVSFFLKTTGPEFKGVALPKDDPYITGLSPTGVSVRHPQEPLDAHEDILIPAALVYGAEPNGMHPFGEMEALARKAFLVLEKAWSLCSCTLYDLKIEFGFHEGRLLIADVIDNDSWRLVDADGEHLDKQRFRNQDTPIAEVARLYQRVAALTDNFRKYAPRPLIVLWCGSESDSITPFTRELERQGNTAHVAHVVCSMHKSSEKGTRRLRTLLSSFHDSDVVVIANVGMSNGAGPVLQGLTERPVISVCATQKDFPLDMWSSLRMPSDVGMLVASSPANAIQAALQIFAERHPASYMAIRYMREGHWLDHDTSPTYGQNL